MQASLDIEPLLDTASLVRSDRIHSRLYRDRKLFDLEMKEIWYKNWVYLAHESELPNKGDYLRRSIGLQPVVIVRGQDGVIRTFFNRCRHRGNLLCHLEKGNSRVLTCPYHGWTYATDGGLLAPTFDEAYASDLSKEEFALSQIARMGSYKGLLFGNLGADGPSLDEHLGEARFWLDLIIDRSPVGGVSFSAGVQKLKYKANWKMLPENSLEGAYHGHFIHKFAFDMFDRASGRDRMVVEEDSVRYLPGGHMIEDFRHVALRKQIAPSQETYANMLRDTYGEARASELMPGRAPMLFIFPNLMFVQTHFRRLQPISVDETYVYYHPTMLDGVPDEINTGILRNHETSFGPAGFLAPDDIEIMERSQQAIEAGGDEWLFIGRGVHREVATESGGSVGHCMDENHLRGMWRHYVNIMSATGT
jgi:phenylpropionate dioxygenase-like ring-hydroxylating dioxygenase large terminal subunit